MKTGRKAFYILSTVCAFIFSICSCSFRDIFGTKLKSIEINDYNKAYVIGDTFSSSNSLMIVGTYYNEKTKVFDLSEVDYSFTYQKDSSLHNQDINTAFTDAGTYTLSVSYEGIRSNAIRITVLQEHIYASSITLSGDTTMNIWTEIELTTNVSPSSYTTPISYTASNDLVTLTPSNNGVVVYAVGGGEVDITAKIHDTASTYITSTVHLTINATIDARRMTKTYGDVVKNNYYKISCCPSTGDVKLLVIPVWFTDSGKYISVSRKENIRQDIDKAYFGTSASTGWESVSSYYYKESDGLLNLTGTVSEWYECGLTTRTVGVYSSKNTGTFVKEGINWYFANHTDETRSDYDYDGDGYLDGVIFIYAAPDNQTMSTLSDCNNLWAYCFWIQESGSVTDPKANVFFWASYDFMYGKETAAQRTGFSHYNGDTSHCSIDAHTYIHEMGHVLGLDDYYDYGGNKYTPAGSFSMQDCNVGGHDPYSLLALGWAKAYIPTSTMKITLRSFQDSHEVILLTPEWNTHGSPFDEYLLLELYTPTGLNKLDTDYSYCKSYPKGVDKVGVRLWHVDARLFRRTDSSVHFYSNPGIGDVIVAFGNTYYKDSDDLDYMSELYSVNKRYGEYKLLQLIRNNTSVTHHQTEDLKESDLFVKGSSFNMETFRKQFYNGTKLNSATQLGWSFEIENISTNTSGESYATVSLTRN